MNPNIKRWIFILETIKTEMMWSPHENDTFTKIQELIKEMKEAVEEEEV